jgi:Tfp pilus assembly PilM family ATPase
MITVGLDIDATSVSIAVLSGSRKAPKLADLIHHEFEDGQTARRMGPETLATLIRGLFRRHKLPTDRVIAAAPSIDCLVRDLHVPFTKDEQIRKTVRFQAESVFQSVPIEDLVIQYHKIAEHGQRSHLMIFGMRRDGLRRYLEMLELAEVDPMKVDLDVGALVNAYLAGGDPGRSRRTLLVDLGGGALRIAVLEGEQLRSMRALRLKAAKVRVGEESSSTSSGVRRPRTLEELREGLLSEERENTFFADEEEGRLPVVILDDDQADLFDLLGEGEETRQSILQKVFVEIDRTLVRTPLQEAIDLVVLTGAGAEVDGIEQAFSEHFECECRQIKLAKTLLGGLTPPKRKLAEREGITAIGLALKGAGHDRTGVDFRTGDFRFSGTFDRIKRGVACTLVLCFVLFFLLAYRYKLVETERLDEKLHSLQKYQASIYTRVFAHELAQGKTMPEPRDLATTILKRQMTIERKGPRDVPQVTSALDMLRDLSLAIDKAGKEVELLDANMRRRRSVVKLRSNTSQAIFDIKNAVNEREGVTQISQDPRLDPLEEGGFQAELVLEPREDKSAPRRTR